MDTGFKKNLLRLKPILHLLPLWVLGLITFPGADQAQMRLQYKIRGEITPNNEDLSVQVWSIKRDSKTLPLLSGLSSNIPCINLSQSVFVANCLKVDLDQKPDEESFVKLIHDSFFPEAPNVKSHKEPESLFYYGKLKTFNPSSISQITKAQIENLSPQTTLILVDEGRLGSERWQSPFGFLTTQELALNAIFNHINGDSFTIQSKYSTFALTALAVLVVASLTYSYPLALAIILSITFYGFLLVTGLVLFERYGYQLSLFAPTLGIFLSYLVSISDQLNQKRRTEYALKRQKENSTELDIMRQNFLSLVSHDLKTPIAKIQALMEKLLGEEIGKISTDQKKALDSVLSANGHLQKTISTLLLLNRIESNQIKIQPTPTDLNELLSQSILNQKMAADEAGVKISNELEPMFLTSLDKDLIGEVVDNLLSNAIKYSPRGNKIIVRCGDDENALELNPPQPAVWFEVQDFGYGVPQEDRERILQKFQRGSREATTKGQSVKGTGLGLYLSKYFVEEHQGKLILISKTKEEPLANGQSSYFDSKESGTVIRVVIPHETS